MTTNQHPVRFGRIAPTIPVTDIDSALAFYCGILGFANVFQKATRSGS